jgi:hypothetical protein
LLVYTSWGASVCSLFRHTAEGWKTYRLVLGPRVQGVWVTDATPSGLKVIELASLADADYRPNLLLDGFAWQKGRVNSVLSTKIVNGFQFANKTAGGNGASVIEVYGRSKPPDYFDRSKRPDRVQQLTIVRPSCTALYSAAIRTARGACWPGSGSGSTPAQSRNGRPD